MLYGRNGVGKTFLLNILCFHTCESEQQYRHRWRDAELCVEQLEAYWDKEADVVYDDLLQVIMGSKKDAAATAAPRQLNASLTSSSPSTAPAAAPSSSFSSSSSLPAPHVRGGRDEEALPNLWAQDEHLARWSQASWLPSGSGGRPSGGAAGSANPTELRDNADSRQPANLQAAILPVWWLNCRRQAAESCREVWWLRWRSGRVRC